MAGRRCYTAATMALLIAPYQPGTRVRITQQMPMTDRVWTNTVEGEILRYRQAKTGSWFAHAKDDQLWLDRLELRMDDGEINILNLDQYTVIEPAPEQTPGESPDNAPEPGATPPQPPPPTEVAEAPGRELESE